MSVSIMHAIYNADTDYRIARNFRGLKFSRISLADLIFEDCVHARRYA